MNLQKLLRLTLLLGGIGLIIGFSLVPLGVFKATYLTTQAQRVDLSYQYMLAAIYFVLGGFMIYAAKKLRYNSWKPFFYFVIISSYLHAIVMIIDMLQGNPLGMSFMPGSMGLIIVATLLLLTKRVWDNDS